MNMNKNISVLFFGVIVLGIVFWSFSSSPSSKKEEVSDVISPTTVSTLAVSDVTSSAGAVLAGTKTIYWKTASYPANVGVNINLIRKVSDSPKEFVFVRALETNTSNDGESSWLPQVGENLDNLYIEVGCSDSYQFQTGCSLSGDPVKAN